MFFRSVQAEQLDHLPADAPAAIRSRQDLCKINWLMGNERWVCRVVRRFPGARAQGVTELGAGDGQLMRRIQQAFPATPLVAHDLAPCPPTLHGVSWVQRDVFTQPPAPAGMLVANLFLHHFEADSLRLVGQWCDHFAVLVFNEPKRSRMARLLGRGLFPWVNSVTRHDLLVSIDAGFRTGELPAMLALDRDRWEIRETSNWRGALRMVAWQRACSNPSL